MKVSTGRTPLGRAPSDITANTQIREVTTQPGLVYFVIRKKRRKAIKGLYKYRFRSQQTGIGQTNRGGRLGDSMYPNPREPPSDT